MEGLNKVHYVHGTSEFLKREYKSNIKQRTYKD